MEKKIAIIGQGYVGLPLAAAFGKLYSTIGFDIDSERIIQLQKGIDKTQQITKEELSNSKYLSFSSSISYIKNATIFIVTVPTPINQFKSPDLSLLLAASKMIGEILKPHDLVIYESTVYPGCTEEDCVPVLEQFSGLKFNQDFFVGYSPERINPGDQINTLSKITEWLFLNS